MAKMRFFDDNMRSWWTPVTVTGGANVPALNDLLAPFGISFGERILNGGYKIKYERSRYASATNIVKFPRGGYLHHFPLFDNTGNGGTEKVDSAILGLVQAEEGRIAVYGDSNCLDSSHMVTDCFWLFKKILKFTGKNIKDPILFLHSLNLHPLDRLPIRRTDYNFSSYAAIIGKELIWGNDYRFDVWATKGYGLQVRGRNHRLPGHQAIDLGSGLNSWADNFIPKGVKHFDSDEESFSDKTFFNFLYTEDLVVFPSHWSVPCVFAVSGVFLLKSVWRFSQTRHTRKKEDGSNR